MDRRFIESSLFPVDVVSEASAKEKQGGGRPPFWEMVFWWTRKPLASARAVIAGALLPEEIFRNEANIRKFIRMVLRVRPGEKSLVGNVPHRLNPSIPEEWTEYFRGKRLLDPFAGFGSIPLEGLRLGLDVTAVELLPTAYVFLKAVLEYPLKYGKRLVRDVERWGKWVTERLKEDPDIKELYDPDVAVYIGSWEIKCPHCGRWTPIVGNWWLARVRGSSVGEGGWATYKRLAWMVPKIEHNEVKIEVVDVNRELGVSKVRAKVDVGKGVVITRSKSFNIPKPNIHARRETATCLLCGNTIKTIDPETGRHYTNIKGVPRNIRKRLEGYVKFALQLYNKDLGFGKATSVPEWIKEIPIRLRLLVKVKRGMHSKFEPCDKTDQEKLKIAEEKVIELLKRKEPDIPTEPIAPFGVTIRTIAYGFDTWHKHFNPKQLLTLMKLVKLARKASNMVEMEGIKKGFTPEEAKDYAEAIVSYLAISLAKYADYNSIVVGWHVVFTMVAHTFSLRRPTIWWNWCDVSPHAETTGSWVRSLKNIVEGLKHLNNALQGLSGKKVLSSLDDATLLRSIKDEKFDLIVTDPPYYDDVQYSELSDFYYVWLKRVLSDVQDKALKPKFIPNAFFKKIGTKYVEVRTQWEEYAKKEVSLNPPRIRRNASLEEGKRYFLDLLKRSFITMSEKITDDGVLVTYYAHTNPEAWEALIEAGWLAGKLYITNAFPLSTESLQRITARGKMALDTSIIVAWRKGVRGEADIDDLYRSSIEVGADRALTLMKRGYGGINLFIGTLSSILTTYTQYDRLIGLGKYPAEKLVENLVRNYIYPATASALAKALMVYAGREPTKETLRDNASIFYLLTKILFPRSPRAGRRSIDRSSLTMLSIGTRIEYRTLLDLKLVEKRDSNFYLHEPRSTDLTKLSRFLRTRELDPNQPTIKTPVDALHIIEYYASAYPQRRYQDRLRQLRAEYPSEVEEALILAKILYRLLPKVEPEYKLIERILLPTLL